MLISRDDTHNFSGDSKQISDTWHALPMLHLQEAISLCFFSVMDYFFMGLGHTLHSLAVQQLGYQCFAVKHGSLPDLSL